MITSKHGVGHQAIQGGEIVVALVAKQLPEGFLADADIQAEDGRATQIRGAIINVAGHERGERHLALGREIAIEMRADVSEEA